MYVYAYAMFKESSNAISDRLWVTDMNIIVSNPVNFTG